MCNPASTVSDLVCVDDVAKGLEVSLERAHVGYQRHHDGRPRLDSQIEDQRLGKLAHTATATAHIATATVHRDMSFYLVQRLVPDGGAKACDAEGQ